MRSGRLTGRQTLEQGTGKQVRTREACCPRASVVMVVDEGCGLGRGRGRGGGRGGSLRKLIR